jgi:alkanesulfonate monooxygenase SsuD/methylene tetrahydromethanopterin reductase-like flavin-dependent oxidoreductase (luciferase family)
MVERATAARDAGLDSLFVGDHHATGSLYFQNTAMLGRLLAAWNPDVAGALFLLPLWNPVLVAEQIGTLAALTEGRFVMQCGIGAGRAQFAAMGVDVKDRRRLFEHHLAVVRALLAGEEVDGVRVAPVPVEPVAVWIGATAPAAIERAARLGDGWLAAPALTLEQAAGQIDSYRAACDGLGRPVGSAVIRQDVHVGARSSDARVATDGIIARGIGASIRRPPPLGASQRSPTALAVWPPWGTTRSRFASSWTTKRRFWHRSNAWARYVPSSLPPPQPVLRRRRRTASTGEPAWPGMATPKGEHRVVAVRLSVEAAADRPVHLLF